MPTIRCLVNALTIVAVVAACFTIPVTAGSNSLVAEVSSFPLKAVLGATQNLHLQGLPAALLARSQFEYSSWFRKNFDPIDSATAALLHEKQSYYSIEFVIASVMTEGFKFTSTRGMVRYEVEKCRFYDCYKGYLALIDSAGRTVWRRRIPLIGIPVLPFEVEGRLLFLGYKRGRTMLLSADLRSGLTSEGYAPEDVSFDESIEFFFPYSYDGYVCATEELQLIGDPETKGLVLLGEPRVFVMKLRE